LACSDAESDWYAGLEERDPFELRGHKDFLEKGCRAVRYAPPYDTEPENMDKLGDKCLARQSIERSKTRAAARRARVVEHHEICGYQRLTIEEGVCHELLCQ